MTAKRTLPESLSFIAIYGIDPESSDLVMVVKSMRHASYNGTDPIEFSSGGRIVHRVTTRGNRKLNHAVHMAAITQIRRVQGRIYFERKVAEGKTKKEASAPSNATSATPSTASSSSTHEVGGREDNRERLVASVTGSTPCTAGSSAKSLPDPGKLYAVACRDRGSIRRAQKSAELGA